MCENCKCRFSHASQQVILICSESKAQKFGKGLLRFYFMSKRNVCFVRLYGSERLPYPCNLAMNFLRSTIKRRCSPSPMVPVSSSAMTLKSQFTSFNSG